MVDVKYSPIVRGANGERRGGTVVRSSVMQGASIVGIVIVGTVGCNMKLYWVYFFGFDRGYNIALNVNVAVFYFIGIVGVLRTCKGTLLVGRSYHATRNVVGFVVLVRESNLKVVSLSFGSCLL